MREAITGPRNRSVFFMSIKKYKSWSVWMIPPQRNYDADKLGVDTPTHTHTHTDASNNNTRRPKLALGWKWNNPWKTRQHSTQSIGNMPPPSPRHLLPYVLQIMPRNPKYDQFQPKGHHNEENPQSTTKMPGKPQILPVSLSQNSIKIRKIYKL